MNVKLTKKSSDSQIKTYFSKILELAKSDNEYPVNLEDVWALVYSTKGHAVEELKRNFIQDIDYQFFTQNRKNPSAGRPKKDYYITVPCLEYFIARKNRNVFEFYRQIFHATTEFKNGRFQFKEKPKSALEILRLTLDSIEENQQKLFEIRQDVHLLKAKASTKNENYFTISGYCSLMNIKGIRGVSAQNLGKKASRLSVEMNLPKSRTHDEKYGNVGCYHVDVLKEVFKTIESEQQI